ncbi:hypothetical protein D3C72_1868270 [compost metagenome]
MNSTGQTMARISAWAWPSLMRSGDRSRSRGSLRQCQRPSRAISCRSQMSRAALGVMSATLQRAATASSREAKPLEARSRVRLRFKIALRNCAGTASSGWLRGPSPSSMTSRATCSGKTPA